MDKFIYKLTNGAVVHPECRESYVNSRPKGAHYIGIQSAIHADKTTGELPPSFMLPDGRFTLCGQCQKPVVERLAEK